MPLPLLQQHSFWRDRRRSVWRLPNNRKEVTRRDMASKKRSWFFLYGNRDLAAACRLLSLPLESTPDLKLPLRQHLARTARGKRRTPSCNVPAPSLFLPGTSSIFSKVQETIFPFVWYVYVYCKTGRPPGGLSESLLQPTRSLPIPRNFGL